MAGRLKIRLDVVELVKKATGSNIDLRDAYLRTLSNDQIKREFGKRCIDSIIDRTLEGIDKNGSNFKGYSKAYKNSDTFKIYGKSPSQVNLKLTGEMQAAIDVTEINSRSIVLGFIDQEQNDKAHGHVHGANYLPVRDFWGISEKDQISILKETIRDFVDLEDIRISQTDQTQAEVGSQEIGFEFFGDSNG